MKENMKMSLFDRIMPLSKKGKANAYLLYNTYYNTAAEISNQIRVALETSKWDKIRKEYLEYLYDKGFLVDKSLDEMSRYKAEYYQKKYDNNSFELYFVPTYACNLKCIYCWQRTDIHTHEISDERSSQIIKKEALDSINTFWKKYLLRDRCKSFSLTFFGGEPFVAKKIVLNEARDVKKYCTENNIDYYINFYTNGVLLDENMVSNLKEFNIGFVRVTLDGSKKVTDRYRVYLDGRGTYDDVIKALFLLKDAKITSTVQLQMNKDTTADDLRVLFDDLKNKGLNDLMIEPRPLVDPRTCGASQIERGLSTFYTVPIEEIPRLRYTIFKELQEFGFPIIPPPFGDLLHCKSELHNFLLVDNYLDVYKCIATAGVKELSVGHLNLKGEFIPNNFYYEWESWSPFDEFHKKCQDCWALPACGGGCQTGSRLAMLQIGRPVPPMCDISEVTPSPYLSDEYLKIYLEYIKQRGENK